MADDFEKLVDVECERVRKALKNGLAKMKANSTPKGNEFCSITHNQYHWLVEMACNGIGLARAVGLRASERLTAAEARIKALEEGKVIGVKYLGTYQRAVPYDKGAVVTYQGDMWTCLQNVAEGIVPGSNTAAWQLSSRAGKPVTVTKPRGSK